MKDNLKYDELFKNQYIILKIAPIVVYRVEKTLFNLLKFLKFEKIIQFMYSLLVICYQNEEVYVTRLENIIIETNDKFIGDETNKINLPLHPIALYEGNFILEYILS